MKTKKAGKMCISCIYFPDNCGYWNKEYRKKHEKDSFLPINAKHNCSDYKESIAIFLPDEMQGFGL